MFNRKKPRPTLAPSASVYSEALKNMVAIPKGVHEYFVYFDYCGQGTDKIATVDKNLAQVVVRTSNRLEREKKIGDNVLEYVLPNICLPAVQPSLATAFRSAEVISDGKSIFQFNWQILCLFVNALEYDKALNQSVQRSHVDDYFEDDFFDDDGFFDIQDESFEMYADEPF